MITRLARLRTTAAVRTLLTETSVFPHQLIAPLFVHAGLKKKQAIHSMPGHYQLALSDLTQEVDELLQLGIKAVLLFGIPETKDANGSSSWQETGVIQQATRILKKTFPELIIIADACFCEYTNHGHCGVLQDEKLHHDATLPLLAKQAVSLAQAGVDWIAPSGMIDGMVHTIRQALDNAGHTQTVILSYSAKYQSCLYGPFREAAEGAPKFGNRATYQMNPANSREALREVSIDITEGADLVMVKPATLYLDIIHQIRQAFPQTPLCAYQVSGEFAMIKAAAQANLLDESAAIRESLVAIRRAGADLIISYFAKTYGEMWRCM